MLLACTKSGSQDPERRSFAMTDALATLENCWKAIGTLGTTFRDRRAEIRAKLSTIFSLTTALPEPFKMAPSRPDL